MGVEAKLRAEKQSSAKILKKTQLNKNAQHTAKLECGRPSTIPRSGKIYMVAIHCPSLNTMAVSTLSPGEASTMAAELHIGVPVFVSTKKYLFGGGGEREWKGTQRRRGHGGGIH